MRIHALFGLLLCCGLLAEEGRPVKVELTDGQILRGRLLESECTDDALVLQDIRSGARQEVPWDRIDPRIARELRVQLAFEVAEDDQLLMTDAVEVVNRAGIAFTGKLLNAESATKDGEYRLKTSRGPRNVPVGDVVKGPTAMRVSALEVFTPVELYAMRLAQGAPADADGHFTMAEFARKVGALEQARDHYKQAIEIPGCRQSAESLQRSLARVEKLLGQKEAFEALRGIREAVSLNSFPKAAKLLEEFRAKYTDEDLLKEAGEIEEDAKARRTDYYVQRVARAFLDAVKDAVEKKGREKDQKDKPLTLRDAMQYASGPVASQNTASYDALGVVAQKLGLTREETFEFWNKRNKRILYRAFYGTGTFLIVPNLKDALQRAPKAKPPQGGGGGRGGGGRGPVQMPRPHAQITPDQWWKELRDARRTSDIRDFLFAYWADKGGMVETIEPKDDTCSVCNGNGYVMLTHNSPEGTIPYADRCSHCHMATFLRVVRFR